MLSKLFYRFAAGRAEAGAGRQSGTAAAAGLCRRNLFVEGGLNQTGKKGCKCDKCDVEHNQNQSEQHTQHGLMQTVNCFRDIPEQRKTTNRQKLRLVVYSYGLARKYRQFWMM